jgi:hypothetical protein
MQKDILASLTRLSDAELVGQMKSRVARERDGTAELVARIAELDTRDLYLREGYSSLFAYCEDVLGLSKDEAGSRIAVARAARQFPVILAMLATGAVHLTAVRLLIPHLTNETIVKCWSRHEARESSRSSRSSRDCRRGRMSPRRSGSFRCRRSRSYRSQRCR